MQRCKLDVASTYLFRMRTALPIDSGDPLNELAALFFFARFDVDVRTGRARLQRANGAER